MSCPLVAGRGVVGGGAAVEGKVGAEEGEGEEAGAGFRGRLTRPPALTTGTAVATVAVSVGTVAGGAVVATSVVMLAALAWGSTRAALTVGSGGTSAVAESFLKAARKPT